VQPARSRRQSRRRVLLETQMFSTNERWRSGPIITPEENRRKARGLIRVVGVIRGWSLPTSSKRAAGNGSQSAGKRAASAATGLWSDVAPHDTITLLLRRSRACLIGEVHAFAISRDEP